MLALRDALKDGFGEAVVACDMPEPCKFPSLDSCQKRFPWTHKEVHLAPYPIVGLMLQVGDTEKFPHARFTAAEEDGGDKRLVELELACEADGERGDKKGKDGMGGEQRTKGEERTGDRSREEAAARKQGRRREHR